MNISVATADLADAAAVAALRNAVALQLTHQFGFGHWSSGVTESSTLRNIKTSRVLVAHSAAGLVGSLRLATKKPWSIDVKYFKPVRRPLYLIDMAVEPIHQRQGIGRHLLEAAKEAARTWPVDTIRLDAYAGDAVQAPFTPSAVSARSGASPTAAFGSSISSGYVE